jgi:PKD domain/Bacterial Ig domain
MQWSQAARSFRTLAVAASGLVLLALAFGSGAPARAAPRDAASCQGSALLGITTRHPVQLAAVGFDAAVSTVPAASIVFYDFSYGDGTDDATSQPTAVHAYQQAGTYLAHLTIVTTCNTVITSPAYHIVVRYGLPPSVAITYPKPDETVHFGTLGLQLRGTASDPAGVREVEIAIQITSVLRAAESTTPGCYWYDGHVSLRLRGCDSPLFFRVKLTGTHWTFRMNPRSQIPPGVYAVRIRATDRVGNETSVYSPKLGDIQAFTLLP